MAEANVITGCPSAVMVPARDYTFTMNPEAYVFRIPRSGSYHDLDPEFFPEDSGEFNLYDEEEKALQLSTINKVLFATKQYPKLEPDQLFVPFVVSMKEEDNIVIVGYCITLLPQVAEEEQESEEDTDEVL